MCSLYVVYDRGVDYFLARNQLESLIDASYDAGSLEDSSAEPDWPAALRSIRWSKNGRR